MSTAYKPAPHVQAALARHGHRAAVQPQLAAPASPARPAPGQHLRDAVRPHHHPFAQPVAVIPPGGHAPHVQTALSRRDAAPPRPAEASEVVGDFISYEDRRNRGGPVPPPKRPVHILHCRNDGGACELISVETGRTRKAETLYAGFVRMARDGNVYIAERQAVDMPGDSHPSIASVTPEGRAGKRTIVAAGEVGIRDGEIVGHNDKTGHYQTRKNKQQSGLPPDKFHPYTENPQEWFKRPQSPQAESPAAPAPASGRGEASEER